MNLLGQHITVQWAYMRTKEFVKYASRPDVMKYMVADPASMRLGAPAARKSVFNETLGRDIGKATNTDPNIVLKVHSAMDEAGSVKYSDMVCIHVDLLPFWDPIIQNLWNNKISPVQAAQKLQDVSDRQLPILFKRWIRNIEFTGVEKKRR